MSVDCPWIRNPGPFNFHLVLGGNRKVLLFDIPARPQNDGQRFPIRLYGQSQAIRPAASTGGVLLHRGHFPGHGLTVLASHIVP